jgi:transposase-like protein
MTKSRIRYDQEFKDHAARYCIEKASSISQGAKELDINKNSIFKWVDDYKERTGLKKTEEKEKKEQQKVRENDYEKRIRELTRQKLELEEDIELLKKVIGMFSERPR